MTDRHDVKYMKKALALAARGRGAVHPNPMVGCVIVKSEQIIGQGYHARFGGPHAEVEALEDCRNLGASTEGATCYVTLEPCCHQGKTGPCTTALIQARVSRVVIATEDPSPHCDGKGVARLRQAGIDVEVGLCRREARLLNAPFFHRVLTGRPWVLLKWAQSLDAQLGHRDTRRFRWISNEQSRRDAHALRRQSQAVLVGSGTVLADDPHLLPRPLRGRQPLRVVLDRRGRMAPTARLVRTAAEGPVWWVVTPTVLQQNGDRVQAMTQAGVSVLAYDPPELDRVLGDLADHGVQQVLVEAGPTLLGAFLRAGLADEICIYLAPRFYGPGGTASLDPAVACLAEPLELVHVSYRSYAQDVRLRGLLPASAERLL